MERNQARVVLFLHPIDHVTLRDGKVAKVEPVWKFLGAVSLLPVTLISGLGVLVYLSNPIVMCALLFLTYLTFIILRYTYSRSKVIQGWTRRLTGKPSIEEKMLLHTLPYYLGITRTSCEVS